MISRTLLRQIARTSAISSVRPSLAVARPAVVATANVYVHRRWYSKPIDEDPQTAEEIFTTSPSLRKIRSSPEVLKVMMEIAEMMQSKGYVTPGEQPGMMAMMKIMGDKELRVLMVKLKTTMDEQGIVLDQSE